MDQNENIIIDGSLYEGGGQILRISIALSIIFQKKFEIINIRKSRPNPGINNQLKNTLDLIINIANANVEGIEMGSQHIKFQPNTQVLGGKLVCGGNTAQSTGLILQCLLPIFLFAKNQTELTIKGGTVVSKSPPSPCIEYGLLGLLRLMGINVEYKCISEGFYPIGKGVVKVVINPMKEELQPIKLFESKPITEGQIIYYLVQDKPIKESTKEITKLVNRIQEIQFPNFKEKVDFKCKSKIVHSKKFKEIYGIVCIMKNETKVFDCSLILSENMSYDETINNVTNKISEEMQTSSCLDEFHQDQLLIFMALAIGESCIRVGKHLTDHTQAALYVLQKFIPQLVIKTTKLEDECNLIQIQGIGFLNK